MRSQPKRKVQAHVLQDQGMLESGGGCVAEHCEDPNWVDEMVLCAGVSCSNQVCYHLGYCEGQGTYIHGSFI